MGKKNNIRSIRFSDKLAELINRQTGHTFTQKFENLITRCVWELPKKEAEIERLDAAIEKKRQDLKSMNEKYSQMSYTLDRIRPELNHLEAVIKHQVEYWEKPHE